MGASRWLLGVLAFGVFIAADDLTVVSTMLPRMIVDFEIPIPSGLQDASWIVSAYLIAYVVAMPLFGRLSDRYGRLRIYTLCMLLFFAGSMGVLLARDLLTLIAARALQALGGGGVVPIAMATVGDRFPERRRGPAIGMLMAVDTLGWIWGPLYGSLLVRYGPEVGRWLAAVFPLPPAVAGWSWQWQFVLNLPLSFVALAMAVTARSAFAISPPQAPPMDWLGAVLLSGSLAALHAGILQSGGSMEVASLHSQWPAEGGRLAGWPWVVVGGVGLAALAHHETRRVAPLIPTVLLQRRNFAVASLINLLAGIGLITPMVQVPLWMNTFRSWGSTPEEWIGNAAVMSARILTSLTLAMALGSLAGGWGSRRAGDRWAAGGGILLAGLGLLRAARWGMDEPLVAMAAHMALVGIGLGAATAAIGAAALDAAPPEGRGIASGLLLILRLVGMSLGLAGMAAWGTARFQVLAAAEPLEALPGALPRITWTIIRETFGLAAGAMALALPLAILLRGRPTSKGRWMG